MSGRAIRKRDRAGACFRERPEARPSGVTSAEREAAIRLASEDPEGFAARVLRTPQFLSLSQLPWWPAFRERYDREAALIEVIFAAGRH